MKNFMSVLTGLLILATSLVGLLFMVGVGHAATYNFYFNNLEQGDNSTANPSLTVTGKKSKKKSDKKFDVPEVLKSEELPKEKKTVTTTEKTTVETTEKKALENSDADNVAVSETVSDALKVPQAETASQSSTD